MQAIHALMTSTAVLGRLYDQSVNYFFADSLPVQPGGYPVYMIGGTEYKVESTGNSSDAQRVSDQFRFELDAIPWITERSGFELIPTTGTGRKADVDSSGFLAPKEKAVVSGFSSDSGWGGTLRATQMMTANGMIRKAKLLNQFNPQAEAEILSLFTDSLSSPLSIHNMISRAKGVAGRSFGASQAGWAMAQLAKPYIDTHLAMDWGLSRQLVKDLLNKSGGKGLLVYVPVRLAISRWIDVSVHKSRILDLFRTVPQFLGIVGADVFDSYYLVAASEDYLYVMDPQTTEASQEVVSADNKKRVFRSQPDLVAMRWRRLASGMMYGFLLISEQDVNEMADAVEKIGTQIGFAITK